MSIIKFNKKSRAKKFVSLMISVLMTAVLVAGLTIPAAAGMPDGFPFGDVPGAGEAEVQEVRDGLIDRFFNSIVSRDQFGRAMNPVSTFFLIVIVALVMGLVLSFVYKYVTKKGQPSQNFAITLMILPPVIGAVVFLIGLNFAAAFSLAGIFSFTRFRSAAANSKDLSFVFVTMSIGVACGMGFVGFGITLTIILCVVLLVLSVTHYGEPKSEPKVLRIHVPESISYHEMFEPIFKKYAYSWDILRVKLVDLGATYEVSYSIALRTDINEKEMLDELRTRNGNLNIILMMAKRDNRVEM